MRRVLFLLMAAALALVTWTAAPASANDVKSLVASPVEESTSFLEGVWALAFDTISSADGYSLEAVSGDVGDATAMFLHSEWQPGEILNLTISIGGTTSIGGEADSQLIGGLTMGVASVKGTKLVVGLRLVSRDISSRRVRLPEWSPVSVRYTLSVGLYRAIG